MIGASFLQSIGGSITADYAIDIAPSEMVVEAQSGGFQSPLIRANPVNGVGPYGFTWSTNNPSVTLTNLGNTGEESSTRISASGFPPALFEGVLICDCIDMGNGNALTQSVINFSIQFI